MSVLTGLYSIVCIVLYAGLLQYAQAMAGFGDGAPQHLDIWTVPTLFPFVYFGFTLITCFIKRPSKLIINAAILMHGLMAIILLFILFSDAAIAVVFVLPLAAFWSLMFLERCGAIRLAIKDTFAGLGITVLIFISIALLILAVIYMNTNLAMESMVMIGAASILGLASYFLLLRFIEKVRVDHVEV